MRRSKGYELPMNVMVVLVILVIVLAVMVVWFMGGAREGQQSTNCQMKWSSACSKFSLAGGCVEGEVNDEMSDELEDYFQDLVDMDCYASVNSAARACCN